MTAPAELAHCASDLPIGERAVSREEMQRIHGTGCIVELARSIDWSSTALGPLQTWSETRLCAVNLMLASRFPCTTFWGPEMVQIYNDAYAPFLEGRHPRALGQRAEECWAEAWTIIQPQLQAALENGTTTYLENFLIPIMRDGILQDVYWTYCYSPIYSPAGNIDGILITAQDTTKLFLTTRRLQQVLSATTDGIISISRSWNISFLNDKASTIVPPNIIGKNFWEQFPGMIYDGSPYVENYNNAMHHGLSSEFEAFYPEPLNAYFSIVARPSEDGIIVFFRDVTSRHREAEALRESEARLSAIYGTSVGFIGLLSPDGTILDCNRAALQLGGTTREKLYGLRYWQGPWFAYTPGVPEIVQSAVLRAARGEVVRQELALVRPSGKILTFNFSISPIRGDDGEVVFLVPEGHDISALKITRAELAASREELHWTIELSAPIPWTADVEGNILEFSRSFLELTGMIRDQVLGKGWMQALHLDDLERVIAVWTEALRSGEPVDVEYRLRTASQEFRWVRARANPRRDVTGAIVKWYGTIEDVEERKSAEHALIRSEADAAVKRMTASLSAQINSPLGSVLDLLAEAADSSDPDKLKHLIGASSRQLSRVLEDTRQILN